MRISDVSFLFKDKRSIWRCLQLLGFCHPDLTLLLVPELLTIHPFFDMPEADIEDPLCNYILKIYLFPKRKKKSQF